MEDETVRSLLRRNAVLRSFETAGFLARERSRQS